MKKQFRRWVARKLGLFESSYSMMVTQNRIESVALLAGAMRMGGPGLPVLDVEDLATRMMNARIRVIRDAYVFVGPDGEITIAGSLGGRPT